MPADSNLVLKASAAITTTTTGTSVDFGVADLADLTYRAVVSAVSGAGATLTLAIQGSDDDSNFYTFATFKPIAAVGVYHVTCRTPYRYRRIYATTAGTSPSATTAVDVLAEGGRYTKF